jgi:hypothetical protein
MRSHSADRTKDAELTQGPLQFVSQLPLAAGLFDEEPIADADARRRIES